MNFYTIIVLEGQTIWDIATREYGGIDGVYFLREDNPSQIPDLNAQLSAGQALKIRKVADVERPDYLKIMRYA